MNKQAILTNFPTTILATAHRKVQAQIRQIREDLFNHSLTGYMALFDKVLPQDFMEGVDSTQRQRNFGFLPTFWAWTSQILQGNHSCTTAVSLIQSWCRALKLPLPSADNSAYCRARKRLSSEALEAINLRIKEHLSQRVQTQDLWKGHPLLSIDGTSIRLMDTEKNQAAYPQPAGQRKDCGFPVMGVVAVATHSHGGIVDVYKGDHRKHDARIAPKLLHTIQKGDVILGDRAFCTYEFTCRILTEQKGHFVMRLHQARHRKLDWRKGKKLSSFERLTRWEKPKRQPPGSQLSKEEWDALADHITVRYIKIGYENRDGSKEMIVVVTDLLDSKKYPGEDVANLYAQRWQIEVKFRDIKTSMGMEHFAVKSPEMSHLSLQMMVISYNLIRCLMQAAAHQANKPVHEMSFQGIRTVITASHESFRQVVGKPRLKKQLYEALIENCAQHTLDIRPFRREPRALKLRPKGYALLTSNRKTFKESPTRKKK